MDAEGGLTLRERAALNANPDIEIMTAPSPAEELKAAREKTYDPLLVGMGGWLFTFVLFFGLAGLRSTLTALTDYGTYQGTPGAFTTMEEEQQYFRLFFTLVAVDFGARMVAIYHLMRHRIWRSVRLMIATIWLVGPILSLLLMKLNEVPDIGQYMMTSVVFAGLWTAYFLTSKRVAATYKSSNPEVTEIFK